jgi:NAD(P)-dependent dehydrogenase (short-subunit alcohol dehydrogenase family)
LFVSSGVARNWKVNTGAYAVTKAALQAIAGIYAKETQDTAILSNTINPGATRTEMRAAAYPQEDPGNLKTANDIAPLFIHLLSPECTSHGADFDADEWLSTQRANS